MSKETLELEVKGLLPGNTYAAWMSPVGGRYVYCEFQAEVGSLTLKREAGGTIQGRILGRPVAATRPTIRISDDRHRWLEQVKTDANGYFELTGLPDSTWTVSAASLSDEHIWFLAEGSVTTGGSIELRLAPRLEDDE